jgi:hypothetical protein
VTDYSYFLTPTALGATLLSLTLVALDTAIVLRSSVWATRNLPRWTNVFPALAFVLMVAQKLWRHLPADEQSTTRVFWFAYSVRAHF